jgi:hypothetical protein
MTTPTRPAVYIRAVPGSADAANRERRAVADAARERGWPAPAVYADSGAGSDGPEGGALARLEAAIVAGRHDALMLAGQGMVSDGGPALLTRLLLACTKNGVAVELVPLAPAAAGGGAALPANAGGGAAPPEPAARPPGPRRTHHQRPEVLTRLRVNALSGLFPGWRIWLDDYGWHARRRVGIFLQEFRSGAPAFCVHARSEVDLAAQLRDQEDRDAGRAAS